MIQTNLKFPWRGLKIPLILILLSATIIAAYYPGLRGPFVFDDSIHIVNNPSIRIATLDLNNLAKAGFSDDAELLRRPLVKMSFALNYYLSGKQIEAHSFKIVNLVIHLLNTGLIYWFTVLLMTQLKTVNQNTTDGASRWVPVLTTALWALHPMQLTSVLYVVQRMNSLSALFVLSGLIAFVYGRRNIAINGAYSFSLMTMGLLAGLVLGAASKENAALLPLFITLIEIIFFKRDNLDKVTLRILWLFYILLVALCVLALIWSIASGIIEKSYLGREYTLTERLLTESRVLWHYIGMVIVPNLRKFSLFHDDIPLSSSLLTPWTTLPAMTSIFTIVLAATLLIRRQQILSFAVLWFLVGHSMESGLIGLEIAHEHRNYLPSMSLMLGIAYGLHSACGKHPYRFVPAILGIILISILGGITYLRAQTWSTDESLITHMARHHPLSARSQYMLGLFKAEQLRDPVSALLHYQRAAELAPHETGYYIQMVLTAATARIQDISSDKLSSAAIAGSTNQRIAISSLISLIRSQTEIRIELENTIADSITHSLKQDPPSALTINILQSLARCTDDTTKDCQRLRPEMASWYGSLLENSFLYDRVRNDFTIYLFNLAMNRRDYDLALQTTKTSQLYDPGNQLYTLMEANIYISRNRLDKAEEILASMNNSPEPLDLETISSRNQLLSMIQTRREAQNIHTNP